MQILEEYKLFVEDTARYSDSRHKVNTNYLAINSLLLTAVAFLAKDAGFVPLWKAMIIILMLIVGVFVCVLWNAIISNYKMLIAWRMNKLREIEEKPEMENSVKWYHAEDEVYPREESLLKFKQIQRVRDLEHLLPKVFILVYSVFFVGFLTVILFARDLLGS
ncbi:MAG: hypothetical protein ACFFCW_26295 [Candidatus Hodarchaeota archaeon]